MFSMSKEYEKSLLVVAVLLSYFSVVMLAASELLTYLGSQSFSVLNLLILSTMLFVGITTHAGYKIEYG